MDWYYKLKVESESFNAIGMAGREKVSLYMIFLVMTFGTIGLISFQTLKERKNSTILLVAKYKEIDSLNNRYEVG